jgi:hypothetical protein
MQENLLVPEYNKPEAPGIWMNFDNTVSIYHVVEAGDSFEKAATDLHGWLREAQLRFPEWPRQFFLDIEGHLDEQGRFEPDFVELQQEFFFYVVAPFVTALETPLTGPLVNPNPQRNDVPDRLNIAGAPSPGAP